MITTDKNIEIAIGEELTLSGPIKAGEIVFSLNNESMIRLCENGDIYIKEKLTTTDMEVVDGMREFLIEAKTQGAS